MKEETILNELISLLMTVSAIFGDQIIIEEWINIYFKYTWDVYYIWSKWANSLLPKMYLLCIKYLLKQR